MKFILAAAMMAATVTVLTPSAKARSSSSFFAVPDDLKAATEELLQFVSSEKFDAQSCASSLNKIYDSVYKIEASHFDRKKAVANADSILNNLWLAKLAIRKRLGAFYEGGKLPLACVNATRDAFRAIRFVEDYVGYVKLQPAPPPKDEKLFQKAYAGGFPSLQLSPGMKTLELRSGDVLLSRGAAYTSAAIARVGDVDGQFSHLAILYIDEKTQKKYVVEAHIEIGAQPATWETYVSDGKARALLFRYPDAELSALAAKKIYELVNRAHQAGKNIPYDFTMDVNNHAELFCTEVVGYGFEMAAKALHRPFSMPLFQTGIHMKNPDFIQSIGVRVDSTFAPADIEVDPRFELLAEWRDFSRMPLIHYHDAILQKEFDWMNKLDYTFSSDLPTLLKTSLLWKARRMPLFSGLLDEKFPKNMSQATMRAVANLFAASGPLFDYLSAVDDAALKKTGLRLTYRELLRALERFRKKDHQLYTAYQRWIQFDRASGAEPPESPKMHWYLRARDEK
jgi:hypothetical protein